MANAAKHWVIVADESKAVFYCRENRRSPLNQRLVIENETAREKTESFLSDKGGRSFDSQGRGRHTMAKEETGPKRQEASGFARKIVDAVEKATLRGDCRDFGLIAAPEFLGIVRHAMSRSRSLEPLFEIDKNVVKYDPKEIGALIERNT